MKIETAEKFKEYVDNKRIEFAEVPEGLAVNYDLTDEELEQLVELEYGKTSQDVTELFTVICKRVAKMAMEMKDESSV